LASGVEWTGRKNSSSRCLQTGRCACFRSPARLPRLLHRSRARALEARAGEPLARRFDLTPAPRSAACWPSRVAYEIPDARLVRLFVEHGPAVFSSRALPTGTVKPAARPERSVLGPKYPARRCAKRSMPRSAEATGGRLAPGGDPGGGCRSNARPRCSRHPMRPASHRRRRRARRRRAIRPAPPRRISGGAHRPAPLRRWRPVRRRARPGGPCTNSSISWV